MTSSWHFPDPVSEENKDTGPKPVKPNLHKTSPLWHVVVPFVGSAVVTFLLMLDIKWLTG